MALDRTNPPLSPEDIRRALEGLDVAYLMALCEATRLPDRARALTLGRADVARIHAGPLSLPVTLDVPPRRV